MPEVSRPEARPLLQHEHVEACHAELAREHTARRAGTHDHEVHGIAGRECARAHVAGSVVFLLMLYGTKPG